MFVTKAKFWIHLQSNELGPPLNMCIIKSQLTASASFDKFSAEMQPWWVCFFHIITGRNVCYSRWKNEMKRRDGKGNQGAQIKEAGCCHSSDRLNAPARSHQANLLLRNPAGFASAQMSLTKAEKPLRELRKTLLLLLLLLRLTSWTLFCFILRSVLWCCGHIKDYTHTRGRVKQRTS